MNYSDSFIEDKMQKYLNASYSELVSCAISYVKSIMADFESMGKTPTDALTFVFLSTIVACNIDGDLSRKEKKFIKDVFVDELAEEIIKAPIGNLDSAILKEDFKGLTATGQFSAISFIYSFMAVDKKFNYKELDFIRDLERSRKMVTVAWELLGTPHN